MITENLFDSIGDKDPLSNPRKTASKRQDLNDIAHKEKALFSKLRNPLPQNIADKEKYLLRKLRQIKHRQQNSPEGAVLRPSDSYIKETENSKFAEHVATYPEIEPIEPVVKFKPTPIFTRKRLILIVGLGIVFTILLINILMMNMYNAKQGIAHKQNMTLDKSDIDQINKVKGETNIQPLFDNAEQLEASKDYISSLKNRLQGVNSYIQLSEYLVALEEAKIIDKIFKEQFAEDTSQMVMKLQIYHHNFLSEIYHRLNKPKKALMHGNIALEQSLAYYGEIHLKTIEQYHLVAFNLDNLGDFDQALKMRHKAIDISLKLEDRLIDQGQLVTAMNNLGQDYRTLGHFEQSSMILQQAIDLVEKKYGIDAPELIVILNNLGLTKIESNHKILALSYLQQSLNLAYRHYGKSHELSQNIAKNISRIRGFRS